MMRHFEKCETPDVELTIFTNRAIEVFEILMSKLEFASTLPSIITHPGICEILSSHELQQVVTAFNSPKDSRSSFDTSAAESLSEGRFTENDKRSNTLTDPNDVNLEDCYCSPESLETCSSLTEISDVYNAIEILYSHPEIRRLSSGMQNDIATLTRSFLRQIRYFLEFIISKMKLMPIEARQVELDLRNTSNAIERSKNEISDMTISLENQKSKQRKEIKKLTDQLDDRLETWEEINQEFESRLTQILQDSEESMNRSAQDFRERLEHIQMDLATKRNKVQDQKTFNKKIEGEFLMKKFKIESQLSALIMKFDTEVVDREEAYKELMKEFEAVDEERRQLMDEMDEQKKIYDSIIREREEKEFEAFRAKYEVFVHNRGRRRIRSLLMDLKDFVITVSKCNDLLEARSLAVYTS
ncbi:hypothetical protein QAD02_006911 [Eretmocerus hayati]|uniref:Uncharacterized protein n=1 Tax=Eretmocerus hayati TaxID=131215 RepID=A0ACC2N2E9_9HYME|nr:hypothetical protein QAD02_006911 [Eretmocerus hayati]